MEKVTLKLPDGIEHEIKPFTHNKNGMSHRAIFSWGTICTLLYIVDENKANGGNKSVTNDIENVIEDIRESFKKLAMMDNFSLMNFIIIYRDSDGNWDGVKLINDKFIGFYPLRTKNFKDAVYMAIDLDLEENKNTQKDEIKSIIEHGWGSPQYLKLLE
jgi:hypothetical protein